MMEREGKGNWVLDQSEKFLAGLSEKVVLGEEISRKRRRGVSGVWRRRGKLPWRWKSRERERVAILR